MLNQLMDNSTFQRLDNAKVVDFLTSAAGALVELGLFSSKDVDNLRLVLSGITSAAPQRERPILLELDRQGADFLAVLTTRYGTQGLCLNLLRHTLRAPLADIRRTLADWGNGLLKKAELLFNRPVYVAIGQSKDHPTLLSTLLVDFSETIAAVCNDLEQILGVMNAMNPHAMAGASDSDRQVDEAVAKALGFSGLAQRSLPSAAERSAKRRFASALDLLAQEAMALSTQLLVNSKTAQGYGMVLHSEQVGAECQRLTLLDFPEGDSLVHWEVRRRSLLACVSSVGEALKQLAQASFEALSPEQLSPAAVVSSTEAAKRRVTFSLIAAGTSAPKAQAATADLFRYLAEHDLAPKALIPGELSKINPALSPVALHVLQGLALPDAFMTQALTEKTTTLGRAKHLSDSFSRVLTALAVGAVLGGCGLKTRPTSDVAEFRPDILFHSPAVPTPNPVDGVPARTETGPANPPPVAKP